MARQGLRWERWSAPLPNSRKRPVATIRGVFQTLADPTAPRLRVAYGMDGTVSGYRASNGARCHAKCGRLSIAVLLIGNPGH